MTENQPVQAVTPGTTAGTAPQPPVAQPQFRQPPQPEVTPTPPVKKPKPWVTIGLAILLILSLGATGYFAYQSYQLKQQVTQESPVPTPEVTKQPEIPSPTPTADPTINWKTYTNDKYGFSFKYPSDWQYQEASYKTQNTIDSLQITLAKTEYFKPIPKANPMILIGVTETTDKDKLSIYQNTEVVKTITIGGITAEERKHKEPTVDSKYIIFFYKNNAFEIESRMHNQSLEHQETFNQILTTFKFTSDSTSNKDKVLEAMNNYLTALLDGNKETALLYLTESAKKEVPEDWLSMYEPYEIYEPLNEFHSPEEEAEFYNQEEITFIIKLYGENDQEGSKATLLFVKENGNWRTSTWQLLP